MNPITAADVQNLHEYELSRPEFRDRVIALKKRRRVALGPLLTLVFENRETVRFQIQEMLRVERIVRPDKVAEEIAVYNDLLPGPGQVAATLFIEVTDPAAVQPTLDRFLGLDEPGRLVLTIGDRACPALFAPGQSREDRISAVHYVRFPVEAAGRRALQAGARPVLAVNQGGYRAETVLGPDAVEELLADLAEGVG